ncbi:MAG: DUF4173 domain-containing protein [Flavobacteriales bacterium]|nr:DUF4173 domain-containing protein [Flavobacteriales bacterium]
MTPETTTQSPTERWLPLLSVGLAAIAFDRLFWGHDLGLNLLLFIILVALLLLQRYTWKGLSITARMVLGGALLAGAMVYVQHSVIAMVMAMLALAVGAALAQEPRLRSLFFTGVHSMANAVMVPFGLLRQIDDVALSRGAPRTGWRWVRMGLLPLLLVLLFTQLYRAGNPKFDHLTAGFMDGLWEIFCDLLEGIFTPHTLFFLFALGTCAALLHRFASGMVAQLEGSWTDALVRTRLRRPHWMAPRAMDPLERERRMGVMLLVAVNALLLVVNVIDINWVWFGFEVPEGFSLKQFVHEGTWLLIISILLSMLLIMYLFRGNQNFYSRNIWLKRLAMLWLAQNFILGISVFLRNYHYISFHGLAYKRIGVIVFLALVLIGLITLYLKVRDRKSLFYMARVNGWAAFAVLIGLTTVDWDSTIVRYNLAHWNKGEIDIDNYLSMGDKVLPLLYANLDVVEMQMERHRMNTVRWVDHLEPSTFRRELDAKRDRFTARYERSHWQEHNLADRRTMRALEAMGPRTGK